MANQTKQTKDEVVVNGEEQKEEVLQESELTKEEALEKALKETQDLLALAKQELMVQKMNNKSVVTARPAVTPKFVKKIGNNTIVGY